MELSEVLKRMAEFDSLVEPQEMVMLAGHISDFITHYEMEYDDAKLAYSLRWEEIKYEPVKYAIPEKPLSDKVTDMKILRDPIYQHMMKVKRTLGELKRYRGDFIVTGKQIGRAHV